MAVDFQWVFSYARGLLAQPWFQVVCGGGAVQDGGQRKFPNRRSHIGPSNGCRLVHKNSFITNSSEYAT